MRKYSWNDYHHFCLLVAEIVFWDGLHIWPWSWGLHDLLTQSLYSARCGWWSMNWEGVCHCRKRWWLYFFSTPFLSDWHGAISQTMASRVFHEIWHDGPVVPVEVWIANPPFTQTTSGWSWFCHDVETRRGFVRLVDQHCDFVYTQPQHTREYGLIWSPCFGVTQLGRTNYCAIYLLVGQWSGYLSAGRPYLCFVIFIIHSPLDGEVAAIISLKNCALLIAPCWVSWNQVWWWEQDHGDWC